MGFNIIMPWKVHLRGSAHSKDDLGWIHKRFHDDPGAHPTLMKEQDLDHLGEVHDAHLHSKGR